MSIAFPPLVRGWRAAVLLAAVALCTPEKAFAGCGDYITYPGDHQPTTANHPDTSIPPKPPCHGPNCHGNTPHEFPPAPPAPVTSPVKEDARLIGLVETPGDSDHSHFDRDSDSARPIDRAFSIFHPPRIG
ncbi:MAG TPA: hypothetical protein VLM40_02440 [Gemmata sp.]|nr:hypothetical protein [Gemmata sp.]